MQYKVIIHGFATKNEVEHFLAWFDNTGEQYYFEEREQIGLDHNDDGARERYLSFDYDCKHGIIKVKYDDV